MLRILRLGKKSQISSFLIAVLVILLIVIMVTVNLGKMSLTKTNTSNAADAGTLAGASTMANGLNTIKDISTAMFADFITTQIAFAFCPECFIAFVIYWVHIASQWAMYALAWKVALDTLKAAKESSLQLAFSNAGIDEVKPRKGKETYEEWLKRKSNFEQWMDTKGYKSGLYRWSEGLKYGQTASAGDNKVRVKSKPPSWIVVPLPGLIWFQGSGMDVCCAFCNCEPLLTLWGIAAVIGATDPIKLTVTRVEPDINLGLWKMRYRKAGEAGISSNSKAHAHGGCVLPFCPDYDSELTDAS